MLGRHGAAGCAALAIVALSACGFDDALFFNWDERRVLCGQSIDDIGRDLDVSRVFGRMADAAAHRAVYNIYAHSPGSSVSEEMIVRVLDEAARKGLAFVTYSDMLDHSNPRAGLALAFDDDDVGAWFSVRDLLARHGARVTFFVTRYHTFSPDTKAMLAQLAADGHDLEAHGVDHLDAVKYVSAYGIDAYLRDEALPSIERLVADGYPASVFAYPGGVHSDEIDRAMLEHVALVRTTPGPCPW